MTDAASEPVIWSSPGFASAPGRVELADAIAAFDGLPDGFYAVDSEWRLIVLNAAAAQAFRLERSRALGQTCGRCRTLGVPGVRI